MVAVVVIEDRQYLDKITPHDGVNIHPWTILLKVESGPLFPRRISMQDNSLLISRIYKTSFENDQRS